MPKKDRTYFTAKVEDIDKFNFKALSKELQSDNPLLWFVLWSAGLNGRGVCNENRVVTAASVLYHTRHIFLNSLQRSVGISLYNNQLQKKGYFLLSKLGIYNSYSTVNIDLHKLKLKTEKSILDLKQNVEDNIRSSVIEKVLDISNLDHSSDHGYAK